jgi:UDPglucose 6-dehydrogenase
MKIAVVGTGYVGLVAGTCFADSGHQVICVDKDQSKVDRLSDGVIPIYEPGLSDLIKRNTREKRLSFTSDLQSAIARSQVAFICVGTPPGSDGRADLSAVLAVAASLAEAQKPGLVVVMKSTVPVGTADKVREIFLQKGQTDFEVVSNPEFLKEGAAIEDFTKPDRVVVGVASPRAEKVMREIYSPFLRSGNPLIVMDNRSAELTKYAANCMLATKISFINEIANLCEKLGADINDVRKGITTDVRIGRHFLYPGVGYGGSCFPKDVDALVETASDAGYQLQIIDAARRVNQGQKRRLFERLESVLGDLKGLTIALWGLAFKPRTDDIREAPALVLIDALLQAGAKVQAYDPEAMANVRQIYGDQVRLSEDAYGCLSGASALVLVTEWNEFRRPDWAEVKSRLRRPLVVDGRNLYDFAAMTEQGFEYFGIGLGLSIKK